MGEFAQMGVWLDMARPAKQAVDTQETAAAKVKKAYQIIQRDLSITKGFPTAWIFGSLVHAETFRNPS